MATVGSEPPASPRKAKFAASAPSAAASASGSQSPPWVVRAWIERGLVPQDANVVSREDLAALHSSSWFVRRNRKSPHTASATPCCEGEGWLARRNRSTIAPRLKRGASAGGSLSRTSRGSFLEEWAKQKLPRTPSFRRGTAERQCGPLSAGPAKAADGTGDCCRCSGREAGGEGVSPCTSCDDLPRLPFHPKPRCNTDDGEEAEEKEDHGEPCSSSCAGVAAGSNVGRGASGSGGGAAGGGGGGGSSKNGGSGGSGGNAMNIGGGSGSSGGSIGGSSGGGESSHRPLVTLALYDLCTCCNSCAHALGVGVYHSGIVLGGLEYTYDNVYEPHPSGSGVVAHAPYYTDRERQKELPLRCTLPLGRSLYTTSQSHKLLRSLGSQWQAHAYDLVEQNCHHWCIEASAALGVTPLPRWVTRSGDLMRFCSGIPSQPIEASGGRGGRGGSKPPAGAGKAIAGSARGGAAAVGGRGGGSDGGGGGGSFGGRRRVAARISSKEQRPTTTCMERLCDAHRRDSCGGEDDEDDEEEDDETSDRKPLLPRAQLGSTRAGVPGFEGIRSGLAPSIQI